MKDSTISVLVTDVDIIQNVKEYINDLPNIDTIIILDRFKSKHPIGTIEKIKKEWNNNQVKLYSLEEIMAIGKETDNSSLDNKSKIDDIAVLMYTSGSSGTPKGVVITHQNILASMAGMHTGIVSLCQIDHEIFLSFLPLAHIFAFQCELCVIYGGGAVSYASPLTIVKGFPGLTPNSDGDFTAAKPTCMAVVPLLLDRIRKSVIAKVQASPIKQKMFEWGYSMKFNNEKVHQTATFWDALLFDTIRTMVFGGQMRMFICAGSYILPEVQVRNIYEIKGVLQDCI